MDLNRYISKQFSNPAGIGGKLVSFVMNRQNFPLYEETIRFLTPANTDRILDIGCGNGYVMKRVAQQYNCTLTGIDPSASILKDALRGCHKFIKNGQITALCQNVNAMSFADGAFSKSYTINTVYFWENLDQPMAGIYRVLKPRGVFINTFYSNETLSRFSHTQFGYKRFTVEQFVTAGQNAGFSVDVMPILRGAAYCIVYLKSA